MFRRVLVFVVIACSLAACSGDGGRQQFETAQFEEKQGNWEHAAKLYREIVRKHAGSDLAKQAEERLKVLK